MVFGGGGGALKLALGACRLVAVRYSGCAGPAGGCYGTVNARRIAV